MASLTLLALLLSAAFATAQPLPPELTAPVNDFAGVIDPASAAELDTLIRRLQEASGDVLVVATVRTFQPYADLQSYAVQMFENHGKGIGTRKGDNGALLVLAVDDRQVRIEVGYGLEGFVTDGFAGEVSRDTMVPYFRRGDYGQGLVAGAARVAQRIADGRGVSLDVPQPRAAPRPTGEIGISPITLLILLYIMYRLIRSSGSMSARRRHRHWSSGVGPFGVGGGWGGGGWGGGGWGGSSGGFGGFGGGRSGGGGGGASW
ncbi:MAG: TPM domain-containing protein [Acidobacteria bacterium]|nr:TPM domain-containing protein [Acidobacteriota bacterium]